MGQRQATRGEWPDEERRAAERLVLLVTALLRAGSLALGLAHGGPTLPVAAALAAQSAWTFGRGAIRLRRGRPPLLDGWVVALETAAGVAALIAAARLLPPAALTTSQFWLEPYTVITAVLLGAVAAPFALRAAAAAALAAAYLAPVLNGTAAMHLGVAVRHTAEAAAWNNAVSYLPFFLIAAVGFTLLRAILGQSERLRLAASSLAAEQARLSAAGRAYRVGHDIPKALLRELRRGAMPLAELRPWVVKYRDDLRAAVGGGDSAPVDLAGELAALGQAFAPVTHLQVDLAGLDGAIPDGAPALLLVEAARELLNNASYHAYGHPVALAATGGREAVTVTVRNGGPGVDPDRLRSTWARKGSTVTRLDTAGGAYEIRSVPGPDGGLAVSLRWPASRRAGGRVSR